MKKLLLALCLFASSASADVLTNFVELLPATLNRTTTISGSVIDLASYDPSTIRGIACRAIASNDSGTTPTLDIIVKTCTDSAGTNCDTICTFTQCTTGSCWTDGSSTIDLGTTTNIFRYVQTTATLAGTTPQYDLTSIGLYISRK